MQWGIKQTLHTGPEVTCNDAYIFIIQFFFCRRKIWAIFEAKKHASSAPEGKRAIRAIVEFNSSIRQGIFHHLVAATNTDDCDDARSYVSPDANESCNDFDDDCDGFADDEEPEGIPPDAPPWFADNDGDLTGDPANITFSCRQPDFTTTENDATDCDDTNPEANPTAREVCNNGIDDDCNNVVDDDAEDVSWWPDTDLDGFGDESASPTVDCAQPAGDWATNGDDCDDADDNVQPNSTEQPGNGVDDDCDPATPDDVDTGTDTDPVDTDSGADTSNPDTAVEADGDGDGIRPPEDCDDGDAAVHPGAEELVDDVDQDCDGLTDPAAGVHLRGCGCGTRASPSWIGLLVALLISRRWRRCS